MANVYSKFMRTLTLVLLSLLVACATSKPAPVPERAEQSQPLPAGDANSHLMIAEIALQRGDNLAASREYLAAARLSSDAQLAMQATRVAFEARQPSIAMQSAHRWLELDATNADAHRYLAITALRMHAIEESAREFDHLLHATYPTPAQGFTDLTAVLVDEDNSYGAYLVMSKLAAKEPKVPEGQYALSVAALRAYNYEVAVSSARKALDLKSEYLDAERLLARALVVSGKSKEGLEIARARARTANDAESRMEVVLLLVASDDETAARAELASLLDVPDARVEALRTLATLEFSAGRLDDAIKYFNELVASGRYVSLAFYSLGSIYERRRDSPNAVKYYTRVISGPYAVDAQLRSARLLALADQRERANQLLDDFMVENPQLEIEMVLGRARLLADEGDAETALALTDAVLARYPDDPTIRYARSLTLERLDRSDEAIKDLKDLLAQRPDDPVALNALGYTLVEHQQDVKEAQAMIRKSLDMTPDNPAVQDSLGWALYRAGDERGALKWLERAYATEKDAEIAAHIGEVHWALGDRTKAREVWDKALADDPSHRYLLETLRRHPE
jgi:tetratricopeptide (TPR) repeat protein